MSPTELEPFLHHAKGAKVAGISVALSCFGIGALGFADSTASLGVHIGLALPFSAIGLLMLWVAFRPAEMHPAIVVLRDRPEEIVWIYALNQSVNGVPSQTFINLGLANGSKKSLAIGVETDPAPLLRQLHDSLAHATFGYSRDAEVKFRKNPCALRRLHAV